MLVLGEGYQSPEFDLKSFLETYDYLGYARAYADADADDEDQIIEFAIKTYQQNLRIEATGKLDDVTKSRMREPRCVVINEYNSMDNNFDSYRAVSLAFEAIFHFSDRLSLATTIMDGACNIYKRLEDDKRARGRYMEAFVAACIFIASRHQPNATPLTVEEICSVLFETGVYEIDQAKEYIVEHYLKEEEVEMATIHHLYLTPLCSNFLGMSKQELKAVQQSVEKAAAAGDLLDIRSSSPISVALAIIFMVTQLSEKSKKTLEDMSFATGVAEDSIKNAYREVYPHAAKIIPEWYAMERDLNNLTTPTPDASCMKLL